MYKYAESTKLENGKFYIVKERIQEIVGGYELGGCEDYEGKSAAEIIYDKITDTGRWSEYHEAVFKLDGQFFMTEYSRGSTEMQDESPYEYDGEWIEVPEVVPKEVTVIKYVAKEAD